jgi:hypothetical protein
MSSELGKVLTTFQPEALSEVALDGEEGIHKESR